MNELKPEDVMRALECFANGKRCEGEQCAYFKLRVGFCGSDLAKDALALLREKDAEIKGLVDGWSKDQDRFEQVCAEKDAEIERLQGAVEQYEQERKYHFAMSRKRIDEAITEFAERVKVKAIPIYTAIGLEQAVTVMVIDRIVKEMREKQ